MMSHHSLLFKRHMRGALYELSFLSSLSASILSFFTGTFAISIGISESELGLLFAVTSALSLVNFILLPRFLSKYPANYLLTVAVFAYFIGLIGNAFVSNALTFALVIALQSASFGVLIALLDIFVERGIDGEHPEGEVRGWYLGFANTAYILGPFLGGLLINMGGFAALFLGASIALLPFTLILFKDLPRLSVGGHDHSRHLYKKICEVIRDPFLKVVLAVYFLLRIFFVVIGIYTAVYLVDQVHMPYWLVGLIIAFSLIPMVIFEIPVGRLLDGSWDHKHVGVAGFLFLAITTFMIPYLGTDNPYAWALLLFCMRIGASLCEIVAETYFFKHITSGDAVALSVFRSLYPLSSMIAPLFASIFFLLFSFEGLFVSLSLMMLLGVYSSLYLRERE